MKPSEINREDATPTEMYRHYELSACYSDSNSSGSPFFFLALCHR